MQFYTVCNEEVMRATYPGEPLFPCIECGQRLCLASDRETGGDLDDGGEARYRCFMCCDREQFARTSAERLIVSERVALHYASLDHQIGSGCCPACQAAATEPGAVRIREFQGYAEAQTRTQALA